MRVTVKMWGNSASVRIPAPVLAAAKLHVDSTVDVREEAGRIIVEPVFEGDTDIASLIARITPDNVHDELDFGVSVGKESL
ncbi:MAG TPA: AbrB/MazE/SpoVT family DNA-binding domain-containing protein [Rudaea sp.]|jgi:antitoxin MazE|nr:AbrB/MazE/SpoVT family DNA-binding domain-containing protein [Rudaea sp.]